MKLLFAGLGLGGCALLVVACGGDTGVGSGQLPSTDGGATGGASSGSGGASGGAGQAGTPGTGGASGTQCKVDGDCPQPGCFMCPGTVCVNGVCVRAGSGTGGSAGTGGTSGALQWFRTCGPPVCQVGAGGSSSGLAPCNATEQAGSACTTAGAECDQGTACSGPLMCAATDPTHGGMCPISRAEYKTDIEYLGAAERAKLAEDVQSIPLVHYRYKDAPEREHLGFIIEDVEPSPGVDSAHDRVDLYGYTSMAVAALQEQQRELEALRREVKELRSELAERSRRREKPREPR